MHESDPCPFANRADPAVGGTPVEALTVVTDQNRPFSPFTDGEVDGSGGASHQRDQGRLVALANDPLHPMAALESHVLDVGFAGFADFKSVQAEQHGQDGMRVVEALGGKEEPAEFAAIQSTPLRRMDLRTADVPGRVGGDPPVYVGEAVEAACGGEAAVDGRGCQTALVHRGPVQLQMGTGRLEHGQPVIGGPLTPVAQIMTVCVERPTGAAGQERHSRHLGLVGGERPEGHGQFCREVEGCHQWSSFGGGGSRPHPKGRARLVESELTK